MIHLKFIKEQCVETYENGEVMNIKHDLVFASESMLYKDEAWGNQNLLILLVVTFTTNLKTTKSIM